MKSCNYRYRRACHTETEHAIAVFPGWRSAMASSQRWSKSPHMGKINEQVTVAVDVQGAYDVKCPAASWARAWSVGCRGEYPANLEVARTAKVPGKAPCDLNQSISNQRNRREL